MGNHLPNLSHVTVVYGSLPLREGTLSFLLLSHVTVIYGSLPLRESNHLDG